ncbi:MAG: hypothetical protein J0I43_09865 [Microbacterium sp.]|uniref:helix-turn-helix domain-containing protein n=1 Tax=Microbacterium sp. TaxID=51671 RepID=UPI001AC8C26C|nr:helix-turn-helix domain-containing protein [Microbacterium sp.]MBN9177658.1 hypothetical protein [Microbacterium sp.]
MESRAPSAVSAALADEIRAEMARQRCTRRDVAAALEATPHTTERRLSGDVPFDVVQLARIGQLLGVDPATFLRRADERALSHGDTSTQPAA